jgi:transposase-like protein
MRKKRCLFCGGINTKKYGIRSKTRITSQGKKREHYQRWFCNDCKQAFKPHKNNPINFSLQVKACELYFDSEASYRAVHRQLGIAPYRLFKIIDTLGANCKSTIDVAKELRPDWSGYLFIDEKRIYIKGVEWFLLLAVDLGTQDIVHWDLFEVEDSINVAWLLIIIKIVMGYPFKGLISDLLPEFYGTSRWLLPGIPHQLCTHHAYKATEGYIKYRYKGGNKFWADRFLVVVRIICRCKSVKTARRALEYLERHQDKIKEAKLVKRMYILRVRFPYLIQRFKDQNLTPDNNIVENVIKQLNQKFKKVAGFESYETAYHSISLLVMRYRFHKFTCSRKPGHNGKSPLELAGVDISKINWVRFSQKQKL